jgi:hypothetical protein
MSDDARANLISTDALLLARHDRDAAQAADRAAHEVMVTAAPQHPGDDPVSRGLVDDLVAVLRGPGGVQSQLAEAAAELEANAEALEAAARTYYETEADAANRFAALAERLEGR